MSTFSFQDYQSLVTNATNAANAVKVGFFKLKDDGDEALVRINCKTVEDLQFASVHTISANGKWLKVSCLDPLNARTNVCPLCAATAGGNGSIGKASKKVYIQMLASYKDKTTGNWSAPVPVIWERPAMFSREIATKLANFGDLTQSMFKITRNGAAGNMQTTYSLDYAVPQIFKPELIPADFSSFNNFNIAKHSYWEKTPEEISTFLTTGAFPEIAQKAAPEVPVMQATPVTPVMNTVQQAPVQPTYTTPVTPNDMVNATPAVQAFSTPQAPTATPTPTAAPKVTEFSF